jgi:hypothetical protein
VEGVEMDEVVAFCPNCNTYETLWFEGDRLMQTRKFHQSGDKIYHDCGSVRPCRLLVVYADKKAKKIASRCP